ncbi:Rab GTPase [Tieghemostelium lacteum]|uniref:Rab GTPase n=1 Tax=Tieghemostelium lacteum TaxID=361077 RepID=A0A151Z334_TIELA|nr:Rab GTPase [Tieghemostelium lacteum]|eukprot:KYQ88373.1 Rab GTPase [Tieghemostelium lacteum]
MEEEKQYKVLLIGDSDVGKTSIVKRFSDDAFDEDILCTIGVEFKMKVVNVDDKDVTLCIWDTAGQEKFRALISSYYRGAHGIILTYDVTKRDSFNNLQYWLNEIETFSTRPNVVKLLVANKIDKENREVSREEGEEFAKKKAMFFIECSAKTKIGIQQAFEELAHKIMETPSLANESEVSKRKQKRPYTHRRKTRIYAPPSKHRASLTSFFFLKIPNTFSFINKKEIS